MGTRFLPGEQTGLVAPVKGLSDLRCRKVFALFRDFLEQKFWQGAWEEFT